MCCKLRQKDNVIMDRAKPLSEPARDTNRQFWLHKNTENTEKEKPARDIKCVVK